MESICKCQWFFNKYGGRAFLLMMLTVHFITKLTDRIDEFKSILGTDCKESNLPDYQGPEEYVLALKAKDAVTNAIPCPLVVDVTSVCFNALSGLPGTLIPSFIDKLNSEQLYNLLQEWEDKSAYVKYSLGFLEDEKSEIQIFQSYMSGHMIKPADPNAFGWEACFEPDNCYSAYSDLPKLVQLEISECKKALRSLRTYLISEEFFHCI